MATITEDYCSFELSKLLKEKGFDDSCCRFVIESDETYHRGAPALQMARRWLMAVHNLFITFELDFSDGAYPMFDAVVYNLATCEKYSIINYDRYSYIKGTEAAIKYCLEHLI